MTYDDVIRIALELPGVEESTSYGTPALKVGGKLLVRLREEGDVIVLQPLEDIELQMLMETQPQTFFQTPHYAGWPTVLIRLDTADPAQFKELLQTCWLRRAPAKLRKLFHPS